MQTTIDIDEQLLETIKREAARRSTSVDAIISQALHAAYHTDYHTGLKEVDGRRPGTFRVEPGARSLTNEDVRKADEKW